MAFKDTIEGVISIGHIKSSPGGERSYYVPDYRQKVWVTRTSDIDIKHMKKEFLNRVGDAFDNAYYMMVREEIDNPRDAVVLDASD